MLLFEENAYAGGGGALFVDNSLSFLLCVDELVYKVVLLIKTLRLHNVEDLIE